MERRYILCETCLLSFFGTPLTSLPFVYSYLCLCVYAVYNSIISACARLNLWEKGRDLFEEMGRIGVKKDVVTYNAVLDAVSSQITLGRRLFEEGIEKGFYAQVSRVGKHWLELDLHFLSLGGGEIALGWWFEECLVPFLMDTSKLDSVQTITIVTGYGKTRTRGRRQNNDGMKKRVLAMLRFMNIREARQENEGRVRVDKAALIQEVTKTGGRVHFDLEGYIEWSKCLLFHTIAFVFLLQSHERPWSHYVLLKRIERRLRIMCLTCLKRSAFASSPSFQVQDGRPSFR
jgi:pentatricopeptide repeat protein